MQGGFFRPNCELNEKIGWNPISEQVVIEGTVNVSGYNEILVLFGIHKTAVYGSLLIPVDVIKNYPNGTSAIGAYDGANYFGQIRFVGDTIRVIQLSDVRFSFSFYGR